MLEAVALHNRRVVETSGLGWQFNYPTRDIIETESIRLKPEHRGFYGLRRLFADTCATLVYSPSTTTTPEPSSMALLGTGLIGLFPMLRRRRS